MRNICAIVLFFFIACIANGQNELKNWYFGTGTDGITFVNNIPKKLSNKVSSVGYEGMVVANDPLTGNLLFYSDGISVINKNQATMQNGTNLTGNYSGAQSVQCCPISGTCAKQFYLFTNSAWDFTSGKISYSIIDFTTNPLGTVINKNTLFWNGPSDQGLCLVNKPNTSDYWLIANSYATATYYVWPLTVAGIGAPISYTFSNVGSSYQMNYNKTVKKLCVTGAGNIGGGDYKLVTLIDFNSNTGVLSNEQQLAKGFYGAGATRFSPDGTKLYADISATASSGHGSLYQYDFITSVWTNMNTCCYPHDLKVGPDGKMYFIHTYNDAQPISVIDFPNLSAVGNACNYHTLTFSPAFNGEVRRFPETIILPTPVTANQDMVYIIGDSINIFVLTNDIKAANDTFILDTIFLKPKYGTAVITGNTISYKTNQNLCGITNSLIYRIKNQDCAFDTAYVLIKGDSTCCITKSSTINQSICQGQSFLGHATSGMYVDTLLAANGCDSIRTLILSVKPSSSSTITQSICQGQSFLSHATSGVYVDTLLAANGCDSIRTLILSVKPSSSSTINQSICQGQSFLGHSASGVYVDTLLAANGCDSIRTLKLTVNPSSSFTINQSICQGQNFLGHSASGVYVDTLLTANGCDSIRTLILTILKTPQPNLGSDATICNGDSLILNPGPFLTYLWQDSSTAKTFTVKQAGVYAVTVTDLCGSKADTVTITEKTCNVYFPNAFTPNGDGKNDVFKILNPIGISNYHLSIYNRYGTIMFQTSDPLVGWDGKINGQLEQTDTFIWDCQFYKLGTTNKMRGTVILIR